MSAITYDRLLPVTSHTFYIACLSSIIHDEHTVVCYDRYRSRPLALYLLPVTAGDIIHGLHNFRDLPLGPVYLYVIPYLSPVTTNTQLHIDLL